MEVGTFVSWTGEQVSRKPYWKVRQEVRRKKSTQVHGPVGKYRL